MDDKKKKSAKKGKSKTEQMRELREKNAAAKPPKGKKASAKKPETGSLVPIIDPAELKKLQHDADGAVKQLEKDLPEYIAKGANIYQTLDDVKQRELWKFTSTPFKSWTAFVEHFAKIVDLSTRTLFGVIGATKALPGVSAEVKKKIGPRKLQKAAKAVKVLKKKTQNPEAELPPEIIRKAAEQPESEFDETLREAGLIDNPPPPAPETAPMFKEEPYVVIPKDAPVEVRSGDPVRHVQTATDSVTGNQKVDRAIAVAIQVYDPGMKIDEALEFVCSQWLKSTCDREGYEDMTNDAAADEIAKAKKNGRKK